MGKPCFSKLTKFFAFALLGAATAIAAVAVLSSPAAAHSHNDGGGTGRTLSSLTDRAKIRLADLFWCRSDVRYPIRYAPQSVAGTTCGTTGAPACPSGVIIPTGTFRAWGRVSCYYTALEIDSGGNCAYPHPIPQCTDNGTKRDFTAAELGGYTTEAWLLRQQTT